jgi:hypothetical protein
MLCSFTTLDRSSRAAATRRSRTGPGKTDAADHERAALHAIDLDARAHAEEQYRNEPYPREQAHRQDVARREHSVEADPSRSNFEKLARGE